MFPLLHRSYRMRPRLPWGAFCAVLLLTALSPQLSALSPQLSDYAVAGIRDLEASVSVAKADLPALEKINKDFGILYRLRDVTIRYRDPDKFRMDSRLGVFIVNGATRYLRVPQLGIKKRDDLGAELSRRHSLLDVGLITQTRLEQMRSRYLRTETVNGKELPVFEATFGEKDATTYILWVDPGKKLVSRRRWLDRAGATRATFDYLEPKEVIAGVWIPTRVEVRNAEGVLAGATVYRDVKANQSPPDSLFALD